MLDAVLLSLGCRTSGSERLESHNAKKRGVARAGRIASIMAIIGASIAFLALLPPGTIATSSTLNGSAESGIIHELDPIKDAGIIRSAVEGVSGLAAVPESMLSPYLGYLDERQMVFLIEDMYEELCDIDARFGTLETLCSDIIAGMVHTLGNANDEGSHSAVVGAIRACGITPNGDSLSTALRSLAAMVHIIDTEAEAVSLLESVENALRGSGKKAVLANDQI